MKKRTLLFTLLALVLCLSMMLVACGDDPVETEPGPVVPPVNSNPANDKQVIANAFPGFSLQGMFDIENLIPEDAIPEGGISFDFDIDAAIDSIVEAIKGITAEGDVTINVDDTGLTSTLDVKDGIVKLSSTGDDMYVTIDKYGAATVKTLGNGAFVKLESMEMPEIPEIPEMTLDDIKALIEQYVPADAQAIIEGFTFPALSVDQIVIEGDYYVISNDYYKAIADDVLNLVADVVGFYSPDDAPTDAEIAETLDNIDTLIDALGIKIGFSVADQNIVGFKFVVDVDLDTLEDAFGGTTEDVVGGYEPLSANQSTDKVYGEFEIKLTADATKLSSATTKLDAVIDGESISASYGYTFTYTGDLPATIVYAVNASVPSQNVSIDFTETSAFTYENGLVTKMEYDVVADVHVPGADIDATIGMTVAPIYSDGVVTGFDLALDANVSNVDTYVDYCNFKGTYEGESVYALGDMRFTVEAKLDAAKLGQTSGTVASIEFATSFTPKSMFYNEYDKVTGEFTRKTDLSVFESAPTLAEATENIEIAAKVMAEGENRCVFTLLGSENGETMMDLNGFFQIGVCEDFGEIPAIFERMAGEDFAQTYDNLYMIGEDLLKAENYYSYYTDGSGLYVYVTYGNVYVGTVTPDDPALLNRFGSDFTLANIG